MSASFGVGHDPALLALCGVTLGDDSQLLLLGLAQGLGCAGVGLHFGQEAQTVLLFGSGTDALELLLHGHGGDRHGLFGLCLLEGGVGHGVFGHPEEVFIGEVGVHVGVTGVVGVGT